MSVVLAQLPALGILLCKPTESASCKPHASYIIEEQKHMAAATGIQDSKTTLCVAGPCDWQPSSADSEVQHLTAEGAGAAAGKPAGRPAEVLPIL